MRVERFPTTQWSVVVSAQGAVAPDTRQALERLCETYWFPVYAFLRSRARHPADAEDLTQGFFASLIQHGSLDSVKPEAGRFRAFLLASAKHYLSAEVARERAEKRGAGVAALPLDFVSADQRYRLEATDGASPDAQFERRWAEAAFEAAEERLRQEFAAAGKAVQFEAFRQYLALETEPAAYAETAAGLEMKEAAVKVAVHRARRRFGELLREQIAQTVNGENAINEELGYLRRVLARD
jgi:RNA polymerase sigma-70 factor (ECF subfamily)